MNSIFAKFGWRFCLVYLDDIIIFSENYNDHVSNVVDVLSEIVRHGLTINYEKIGFSVNKSNI